MKKSALSRNLRKLRSFKNMTQTDFAALFGLNRPNLGSYEEGRSEPKLATLEKIARHFKLTIDDLVCRELTVNQIAGFEHPSTPKGEALRDQKLEHIERRLGSIEAAIRLLAKTKT